MSHQLLQRCDYAHIALGTMISFPLFVGTLYRWSLALPFKKIWRCSLVILCFVIIVFLPPIPQNLQILEVTTGLMTGKIGFRTFRVLNGKRFFPLADAEQQKCFANVINFLTKSSYPGQTVYIAQQDLRRSFINDIFLYHLLLPNLQPGCYYIESNPLVANAVNSGLERQLANCDRVVLNETWNYVEEPNLSQRIGYDGPVRVLATQFTLVLETGSLTVYRNNRLTKLAQ